MKQMILLVEDEPFILMDLQYAVEDAGQMQVSASTVATALAHIDRQPIELAILDVALGPNETCLPIASALTSRGIPFLLHTGDADRLSEGLLSLKARVVPKPAPADRVVADALKLAGETRQ